MGQGWEDGEKGCASRSISQLEKGREGLQVEKKCEQRMHVGAAGDTHLGVGWIR